MTESKQSNPASQSGLKTEAFDYELPPERIAQSPALPRETCKMLVLHKGDASIEHKIFSDVLGYLHEGDLLVVNNTKVMAGRLLGHKAGTATNAEVLLLQQLPHLCKEENPGVQYWEALVKPGRRLKPGAHITIDELDAEVVDWVEEDGKGRRILKLTTADGQSVDAVRERLGKLPLPPYIKDYTGDTSLYQTVYAHEQNSAAAPTAGLHFSEDLLQQARALGCELATVNLEIGLDTFRTVEEEFIADHAIHSEFYSVSEETVEAIKATKSRGGRVFAVGTTAVRALESAANGPEGLRSVQREQTRLYITPGYEFKVVDALITNFHTPRSTLLMLVSAFVGYDAMMHAYSEALQGEYRFLSFGDAMLIV